MRREVIEFRSPLKQIAAAGGHGYIILNISARKKGIRVILDSSI
jgi:hypothetical protein